MFHKTLALALGSLACGAALAGTATAPVEGPMTLSLAQTIDAAVRAACAARGREVAVAVLDGGAQTVSLQRGNRVGPHNLEAARRKAYTAVSTQSATLAFGRQVRGNPDTLALAHMPELLLVGGGLPLWRGGDLIGAVGVAGGGGPEGDEGCARAALAAAGLTSEALS